ncbi:MAG: tRNA glutamyl-Q(34) synthetase GluQRS [Caulobacteraceae bacterium]|nr:tRNA glutamyl-Q(34) synthetase GluQRS [Caulobacteraceae bacterium]
MTDPGFVTRFAPSPTGLLHRGHAFSALTAFEAARAAGGRFLLRVEDIDHGRCRPEFESAILEDLAWLGLTWETPVRRQSEHMAVYRDAVDRLRARGLVYRCSKTRREALADIGRAPHGPPPPPAPGPASGAFAWRLSLAEASRQLGGFQALGFIEEGLGFVAARPEGAGDVILARKDLGVAYHLAVVIDDALQGVTHVMRGADLFEATHNQRVLQALLGLPTPIYRHHRLLLRADGKRYAKRDAAETLRDLRARGVGAPALLGELGY